MTPSPVLTIAEFAEALRVSPRTVEYWIARRRIAVVKLGRLVRIPREEVARLIEENRRPAWVPKPKRGSA